jgi:endonuclease/exonuclease/phosphatase family metal-dependent hydrolase
MNAQPLPLRVITYNLKGGTYAHQRKRELDDLTALRALDADIVGLQECKWWDHDHGRQLHAAERALDMSGTLLQSNSDGCHLGLFVNPSVVGFLEERHRTHTFHHGVLCVRTRIHGRLIDLAVAHFAPSSPRLRETEAELFKLVIDSSPVIAMGDWNAAASEEAPLHPSHCPTRTDRRKLDTRAAEALDENGLTDVGAYLGDLTPTVGHTGENLLAYRCDRILTNLPTRTFTGHRVHRLGRSDHLPVEATFDLANPGDV